MSIPAPETVKPQKEVRVSPAYLRLRLRSMYIPGPGSNLRAAEPQHVPLDAQATESPRRDAFEVLETDTLL